MNHPAVSVLFKRHTKIHLFLSLSRTPHALIDMTSPAFAALLCIGGFPPFSTMLLGLLTAFAGYTCVYALNDVIDFRTDQNKSIAAAPAASVKDLDAVMVRHPLAQGLLSLPEGILWSVFWGGTAMLGAYWLNPICLIIFLAACLLETAYCLLLKVTPFRALLSGGVKAAGALAASFAVDPTPSPVFLATLVIFFFLWEIGGQNIPNDWADMDQDHRFSARTIPLHFGPQKAATLILVSLVASTPVSALLFRLSSFYFEFPYFAAILIFSCAFLIYPGIRLYFRRKKEDALTLFNRASYYPFALFILVLVKAIF